MASAAAIRVKVAGIASVPHASCHVRLGYAATRIGFRDDLDRPRSIRLARLKVTVELRRSRRGHCDSSDLSFMLGNVWSLFLAEELRGLVEVCGL